MNLPIAAVIVPSTFLRVLHAAAMNYLTGPVTRLFPHLLRHACATHNYERGMALREVQKVLGHEWATTTLQSRPRTPTRSTRTSRPTSVRRNDW